MTAEPIADRVLRAVADWGNRCVNPTHIVMSVAGMAKLETEQRDGFTDAAPMKLWGLPVVIAAIPDDFALGSDRARDAIKALDRR